MSKNFWKQKLITWILNERARISYFLYLHFMLRKQSPSRWICCLLVCGPWKFQILRDCFAICDGVITFCNVGIRDCLNLMMFMFFMFPLLFTQAFDFKLVFLVCTFCHFLVFYYILGTKLYLIDLKLVVVFI